MPWTRRPVAPQVYLMAFYLADETLLIVTLRPSPGP
jgi:hypothetical protein